MYTCFFCLTPLTCPWQQVTYVHALMRKVFTMNEHQDGYESTRGSDTNRLNLVTKRLYTLPPPPLLHEKIAIFFQNTTFYCIKFLEWKQEKQARLTFDILRLQLTVNEVKSSSRRYTRYFDHSIMPKIAAMIYLTLANWCSLESGQVLISLLIFIVAQAFFGIREVFST